MMEYCLQFPLNVSSPGTLTKSAVPCIYQLSSPCNLTYFKTEMMMNTGNGSSNVNLRKLKLLNCPTMTFVNDK